MGFARVAATSTRLAIEAEGSAFQPAQAGLARVAATSSRLARVLTELGGKAARLTPPGWRAHLALFARSGFTTDLRERAEREGPALSHALSVVEGGAEGIFLVDLEQVAAP